MKLEWNDLYVSVLNKNKSINLKYVELVKCSSGSVCSGEIQAIMGPSGGGKSTLLNSLAGRIPPGSLTQGTIKYNDELKRTTNEWFDIIEFVEQEPSFVEDLTLYETLLCSYRFSIKKRKEQQKRKERNKKNQESKHFNNIEEPIKKDIINIDELSCSKFLSKIIEDLGLEDVQNNLISKLSGGEKKRTSIGMALASQPEVLFFDEPTSGLDTATSLSIISMLKKLAVQYQKILIITLHQPSMDIFTQLDKLILISKGNVLFEGRTENVGSFFIDKGYIKGELASVPEFILDICRMNSRNKNQDLIDKENELIGVKKLVKNDKIIQKNNENHFYLATSFSDIYYLILRQIYIARKNKFKLFKSYLIKFILALFIFLIFFTLDYYANSAIEKNDIASKYLQNSLYSDKITYSKERDEIKDKISEIDRANQNIQKYLIMNKLISIIFFIFVLTSLIIFTASKSFFDSFMLAKLEILNHQFSSSSFYIFMFIKEFFVWATFSSLFCVIFSIFYRSIESIFLIVNLLVPMIIIPYAFTIGMLIPFEGLSMIIVGFLGSIALFPTNLLNNIFLIINIMFADKELLKFVPYLFYIFAFIPSIPLFELLSDLKTTTYIHQANISEEDINRPPALQFLKGIQISTDQLYYIIPALTIFYLIVSFSLCCYRQGPSIRLKTQKS